MTEQDPNHPQEPHNPYAAPASAAVPAAPTHGPNQSNPPNVELASRWLRLAAAIIDGFLHLLVFFFASLIPSLTSFLFYALDYNLFLVETLSTILTVGLSLGIYILLHGYFIHQSGQTIGKKAVDIVIVNQHGHTADFTTIIFKRELFFMALIYLPVIGWLAVLANIFMLFLADKRCGHDHVAGTRVVTKNSVQWPPSTTSSNPNGTMY